MAKRKRYKTKKEEKRIFIAVHWQKIIAVMLFFILILLPLLVGLQYDYVGKNTKITYGLMFQYFLTGEPSDLIFETPKPLVALLYYFLSPPLIYILLSLLTAISFLYFVKLTKFLSGYSLAGILAFLYTLFIFEDSYQNLLACYWLWLYIPLVVIALYYFFTKDFLKYSLVLTLSGLVRPESWFLALIILVHSIYRKFPKKYILLIPFLAPLLWLIFDARAFHNPLYSYVITARYPVVTGIPLVNFFQFLPSVFKDIDQLTGTWFLLISIFGAFAGLLFLYRQKRLAYEQIEQRSNYGLFLLFTFVPFIFYQLLSIRDSILPMRRFFIISLLFLTFYAFNLPNLFLKKSRPKLITTFLLLGLLLFLNLPGRHWHETLEGLRQEQQKMKTIEASFGKVAAITDSLKTQGKLPEYLIVPLRRKAIFAYYLPFYKNKIESFREIAALRKSLKGYAPSLVYFLKDDFAGLEHIFSFLSQVQTYPIAKEGIIFIPIFSQSRWTIYLLDNL